MANLESKKRDSKSRGDGRGGFLDHAYRTYWRELCRTIERQFGIGPPDPEEAAQSAFERLAKIEDPSGILNPRAFLHTTARNFVLDQRRRAAVRSGAQSTVEMIQIGATPAEMDSERVLLAKEQLAIVDATVRAMEPRRREVLIMHNIHGLPFSQIAQKLQLSEARVRQLMASALALCAASIETEQEGDDS